MKIKHITYLILLLLIIVSCGDKKEQQSVPQEDLQAKKTIQGIWLNEDDGDATFYFHGDTCYYPVGSGEPVSFTIFNDTIHFSTSTPTAYSIKALTSSTLRFINADGDEVNLVKGDPKEYLSNFIPGKDADSLVINQNKLIRRDTILNACGKRLHIYTQVNPKSERVYKQTINDDGVAVDNAFYGNSVYITIMDGNACKFRHNFHKIQFKKLVPPDYLNQSILSDIIVSKTSSDAVFFTAIIAQPDSYSSYNVKIKVTYSGKISMVLE